MTRLCKIIALIVSVVILASALSSCDLIEKVKRHIKPDIEPTHGIPEKNDREYVNLGDEDYSDSSNYTPVSNRHSYAMLSDGQKALYDALYENVRDVYPETDEDTDEELYKTKQAVIEGYILSSSDIRIATKALYDDNPELFWLSGTIYQLADQSKNYTAVQMRSIYSPEEIKSMQTEIDAAVDAFHQKVPEGLSAYEREKYVHDYIASNCEYDSDAADAHDSTDRVPEAYHIYGALVKGKAVCEGYARSMQLLLCVLGVDCVGITGVGYDSDGSDDLHMWNAVSLDDGWYYVDPTWDDQLYEYRRYQYFNLDEKTMAKDHENSAVFDQLSEEEISGENNYSEAMNIFVPVCEATHYSYYSFECPHYDDYDGDAVVESLYRAAVDQAEFFTFYIDPGAFDYESAINELFKESPQYFFIYAGEVNEWLSDYEIDDSNLSYYTNAERSAVTVMLEYY